MQTLMKYLVIIAFVLSLILAYPLSKSTKPHIVKELLTVEQVSQKSTLKKQPEHKTIQSSTKVSNPLPRHIAPPKPKPVAVAAQPVKTGAVVPAYDSCSKYASLFEQYDWDVHTAIAICQAESSGIPDEIYNGNYDGVPDYGLMQLHGVDILDPAANIKYAYYHKYLENGWEPWMTYQKGTYLQYL